MFFFLMNVCVDGVKAASLQLKAALMAASKKLAQIEKQLLLQFKDFIQNGTFIELLLADFKPGSPKLDCYSDHIRMCIMDRSNVTIDDVEFVIEVYEDIRGKNPPCDFEAKFKTIHHEMCGLRSTLRDCGKLQKDNIQAINGWLNE